MKPAGLQLVLLHHWGYSNAETQACLALLNRSSPCFDFRMIAYCSCSCNYKGKKTSDPDDENRNIAFSNVDVEHIQRICFCRSSG
jgi:hypothetical protein